MLVSEYERALENLVQVTQQAGKILLNYYNSDASSLQIQNKADSSPVTLADRAADDFIYGKLTELWPQIPIISEESKLPSYESRKNWSCFWLVDPLDGTKEFIKRYDEFTVNIALIKQGIPVLGLIGAPALNKIYFAAEGCGAWRLEDRPWQKPERIYSFEVDPKRPVRIVESRSHPSEELETYLKTLSVSERVKKGSSLKFCILAEGNADLYPRFCPTMEWDVAAGDCIFRNSGQGKARTSLLEYNKPDLKNGSFIIGLY